MKRQCIFGSLFAAFYFHNTQRHQVCFVEQVLKRHGVILYRPARTMAGCGGKCVGHDVDGLNTATLERMNQFRSRTGMIKAWLSLCFSCQAACCLGTCWIWHLPASTTYLVYDTRFLPLRWRHLVYSCLYSCASCAGGFVLWHRGTWYLEWTHGTDSCLQNVFFFWLAARKAGEAENVVVWIGLGDEYGGLLWSWGRWG